MNTVNAAPRTREGCTLHLINLLVVGGIIGWIASMIMRTDGQRGMFLNIVVGILGALLAGFIVMAPIGGASIMGGAINIQSILISLVGAIALLATVNILRHGPVRRQVSERSDPSLPYQTTVTGKLASSFRRQSMKHIILGAAAATLLSTGALAQTGHAGSHNPAVKNSSVGHVAAPADGRNSFTEAQARGRMAKAGYSNVSKLAKDGNGVWQGTAMHRGKKVHVGLDYKGNVTTR